MNTKILLSNITHQRFIPFKHKLKYNVPSLFLNLSELRSITKNNKLFSLNSFNLFSFYESDHGYRDNRSIEKFIMDNLNKFKIKYKKLCECTLFLNSGGVTSKTFYIPMNFFFLKLLIYLDKFLSFLFPKIFSLAYKIVLIKN